MINNKLQGSAMNIIFDYMCAKYELDQRCWHVVVAPKVYHRYRTWKDLTGNWIKSNMFLKWTFKHTKNELSGLYNMSVSEYRQKSHEILLNKGNSGAKYGTLICLCRAE